MVEKLFVLILSSQDDTGATAVEYGLMVAMIAIVIIAAVTTFGLSVTQLFAIPAGVLGP